MANQGKEEDYKSVDPMVAANSTTQSEPLATEADEKYVERHQSQDDGDAPRETTTESIVKRPNLDATKSYATSASGLSTTYSNSVSESESKRWYKKLNPLRWGATPPVPKERLVSREYGASVFSLMIFSWMGPLMTVRLNIIYQYRMLIDISRQDTSVH
jgi:ATP-binding cassette subfamily C (CFTR/MRP) protein 1